MCGRIESVVSHKCRNIPVLVQLLSYRRQSMATFEVLMIIVFILSLFLYHSVFTQVGCERLSKCLSVN